MNNKRWKKDGNISTGIIGYVYFVLIGMSLDLFLPAVPIYLPESENDEEG